MQRSVGDWKITAQGRYPKKSTYEIVTIKGFGSGTGALIVAMILGESLPQIQYILPAFLLGFVAYGLSIFTYIKAQKDLGAAKTSAYYAIAPFIGAFLSFVLLQETLTVSYLIALLIMVIGTIFVIADTLVHHHAHVHVHTLIHTHDGTTHKHTITHTITFITSVTKSMDTGIVLPIWKNV